METIKVNISKFPDPDETETIRERVQQVVSWAIQSVADGNTENFDGFGDYIESDIEKCLGLKAIVVKGDCYAFSVHIQVPENGLLIMNFDVKPLEV